LLSAPPPEICNDLTSSGCTVRSDHRPCRHQHESKRVIYRVDEDTIVIAADFMKKTQTTPKSIIDTCRQRYREYDDEAE